MYLTDGNLGMAVTHFEKIIYLPSENYRYQLDQSFSNRSWRNIFNIIDLKEHIFTIWFNKSYFQQNQLQTFFEPRSPHKYMMKPTLWAVLNWETIWDNYVLQTNNSTPWTSRTVVKGMPGDFNR